MQQVEIAHLRRMCEFLARFTSGWETTQRALAMTCTEFNDRRVGTLCPEPLLARFVATRGTGTQEPLPVAFEDVEVAVAFKNGTNASTAPTGTSASSCGTGSTPDAMAHPNPSTPGWLRAASAFAGKAILFKHCALVQPTNSTFALPEGPRSTWVKSTLNMHVNADFFVWKQNANSTKCKKMFRIWNLNGIVFSTVFNVNLHKFWWFHRIKKFRKCKKVSMPA